MKQTIRTARYEKLLAERITMGRLYVDNVSHGAPFEDATRIFDQINLLEKELDAFRRFRCDEYRVVMSAEDQRWHVPGQPPVGGPECGLCVKAQLHVSRILVLHPHVNESASRSLGEAS